MTTRLAPLTAAAVFFLGVAIVAPSVSDSCTRACPPARRRPAAPLQFAAPAQPAAPAQVAAPPAADDPRLKGLDSFWYYGPNNLWKTWSADQRLGRDTWIFWTGGNQKFLRLATILGGQKPVPVSIELLRLLDSRHRHERFQKYGLINEPNFEATADPDPETGLRLDAWKGEPKALQREPGKDYPHAHYASGRYLYYPDPSEHPEYGEPTGVVGLRKFKNPKFDDAAKKRWQGTKKPDGTFAFTGMKEYFDRPWAVEPPYVIGFSCAFCHMSFDPNNPPADAERPRWSNLAANMGNLHFREGDMFFGRGRIVFGDRNPGPNYKTDPYDTAGLQPDSLLFHYATSQQPGTSETSRISYDFINNPNTMNSIFSLGNRPVFSERAPDGQMRVVNHVLKDGADSVGIDMALLRVWINIGCEGRYWVDTLFNPGTGHRQRPFGLDDLRLNARADSELTDADKKRRQELRDRYGPDVGKDWAEAHRRNPYLLAYLASYTPYHLKDAPGGKALLLDETKQDDRQRLENGGQVFARECASCHSSKQPMYSLVRTEAQRKEYFLNSVKAANFRDQNTLSDDVRYSVREVGTNMARALATNAVDGDVWAEVSSQDYKALPPVGRVRLAYTMDKGRLSAIEPEKANPANGDIVVDFMPPGGGRGYYRTPSLISLWATAPYFHNNALGDYYVVWTDQAKGKGWLSNDGTRWRARREDPWQTRPRPYEIDYRFDPSVEGRVLMFQDGVEKLLSLQPRDGWIKVVPNDCHIADLKPLFQHLLPGVLADLVSDHLLQLVGAEVDAYLKDKDLPDAVKKEVKARALAAAADRLKKVRDEIKPGELAALKEQLVELAKDKLLNVVADAAGPGHAAALQSALAGLHMRFSVAAEKLLAGQEDLLKVPAGTPLNLYFNLGAGALPFAIKAHLLYRNDPRKLAEALLNLSDCPDLVEDKGHTYGKDLSPRDKRDLIEYLKTL